MINTLDGPKVLSGAFGAMYARSILTMLRNIEHPKVVGEKIEYGVPYFDDMDADQKAILLYDVTRAFFTESNCLAKNASYAATIDAICCNFTQMVALEIEMRFWTQKKYGKDACNLRASLLAAFHEQYPNHPMTLDVLSDDTETFTKMSKRLSNEIVLDKNYLLAYAELKQGDSLTERMQIPTSYFDVISETQQIDRTDLINDANQLCMKAYTDWLSNDTGPYASEIKNGIKHDEE